MIWYSGETLAQLTLLTDTPVQEWVTWYVFSSIDSAYSELIFWTLERLTRWGVSTAPWTVSLTSTPCEDRTDTDMGTPSDAIAGGDLRLVSLSITLVICRNCNSFPLLNQNHPSLARYLCLELDLSCWNCIKWPNWGQQWGRCISLFQCWMKLPVLNQCRKHIFLSSTSSLTL